MNDRFYGVLTITIICGITFGVWQDSLAAGFFMAALIFAAARELEDFR